MLERVTQVKHFDNDKSLFQNNETGALNMIEEQNIPELPEFLKPLVENTSGDLKETELFGLTRLLYQITINIRTSLRVLMDNLVGQNWCYIG